MQHLKLDNETHCLGAPADWAETELGKRGFECEALSTYRDEPTKQSFSMWRPTPDELILLLQGYPIVLSVMCERQPVVALFVQGPEKSEEPDLASGDAV
jgi:hypothetical protein